MRERTDSAAGEIRSFIAVELPVDVRNELGVIEEKLRHGMDLSVKWVNPKSIHLTLKFLGNIPQAKVPQIADALATVTKDNSPFSLELGELGVFPNLRRPRVIWLGLDGDVDKLISLQKKVDAALEALGFAREARPFKAHLTLGRVRGRGGQHDLGELLADANPENGCCFEVNGVSLMKSRLTPQGAIYMQLALSDLQG
ncbi:MAG: RNA 2',3'-cyclic phosphodiesterase [Dehalococcoidia bacterium]|nr:RNA 2',3'-cyclic phosphodiesterase [Dehalococcoidia bacterium]